MTTAPIDDTSSGTDWIDFLEQQTLGALARKATTARGFDNAGDLARHLNPKTVQTPALDVIDAALEQLVATPNGRLIVTLPPQEGKSTRVAKDFALWVLKTRPWTRVVTASYSQQLANRNGRAIRNTITANPDLGLAIARDNGSVSEWQLADPDTGAHLDGGVLSVGIGAGVTGMPADLLIIDDPVKDRKEADSEVQRDNVWDWWRDTASTRLAPGAPVVVILTRWHEDDLAGRLLKAKDGHLWKVVRIPAQADHQPENGETDPLDREPGEYLESARGRTDAEWEAIKTRVGTRTWQALYQGNPSTGAGLTFPRDRWRYYDIPPWLQRPDGSRLVTGFDQLLLSWDMAFKDTAGADNVSGTVWASRGAEVYLLDRINRRMDFPETLRAFAGQAARWPQAILKLVEDKANGTAVIAMLHRTIPGIVPVEPEGGKIARANAVAPIQEARNVWLPSPAIAPWVTEYVDELARFPTGKHDDDVDSTSQAWHRLIVEPLLAGAGTVTETDLDEELAGYGIVPYA